MIARSVVLAPWPWPRGGQIARPLGPGPEGGRSPAPLALAPRGADRPPPWPWPRGGQIARPLALAPRGGRSPAPPALAPRGGRSPAPLALAPRGQGRPWPPWPQGEGAESPAPPWDSRWEHGKSVCTIRIFLALGNQERAELALRPLLRFLNVRLPLEPCPASLALPAALRLRDGRRHKPRRAYVPFPIRRLLGI